MEKKEIIKKLVFENNHQAYSLSSGLIDLKVIQNAVSQLMKKIDEVTHKKWDENQTMAQLSIAEIKDAVRLIDMAFHPLFLSLNEDVEKLETHSNDLFEIFAGRKSK